MSPPNLPTRWVNTGKSALGQKLSISSYDNSHDDSGIEILLESEVASVFNIAVSIFYSSTWKPNEEGIRYAISVLSLPDVRKIHNAAYIAVPLLLHAPSLKSSHTTVITHFNAAVLYYKSRIKNVRWSGLGASESSECPFRVSLSKRFRSSRYIKCYVTLTE